MAKKLLRKWLAICGNTGADIWFARLVECSGDIDEIEILRKKGVASAARRQVAMPAKAIESYIHLGGKVGVLCEINCESDFVAKTDDFKQFVRISLALLQQSVCSREEIDPDCLKKA